MISLPVYCKTHVGRASELEHLIARRRAAGDSHGGLVVVAGEAGIGKSRLVTEFVRSLATSTARIARAECREFAQDPFGPIVDAIGSLDPTWHGGRTLLTPADRLQALLDAFEFQASRRTTVAIVEDLHCADPDLIRTLRILAARAATQRLLFVVTIRDESLDTSGSRFTAYGQLLRERAVSIISLTPLAVSARLALVDAALEGRTPLAQLAVEDIARRCDGNPLFAEELLRFAIDRQSAGQTHADERVPTTLQAVVRERLNHCTVAERELLAAASLCGRRFRIDVLDRVAPANVAIRASQLENLCALQLILPFDADGREYAFRHALTRDTLYGDLIPSETKPVHEKIAHALHQSAQGDDYAMEIAYHFWQAGARSEAAPSFVTAARAALARLAYRDAIRWFERAAGALVDPIEADGVRLEIARTYAAAEDATAAIALYRDLAGTARARGDLDFYVRTRKLMAGILSNNGLRENAVAMLEETLTVVPEARPALRAEVLLRIASIELMRQDTGEAHAAVARLDVRGLEDGSFAMAEFYLVRAQIHAREGRLAHWRQDFAAALELFERRPTAQPFVRFAHVVFAWQAYALGLLHVARNHLHLARAASARSASSDEDVPTSLAVVEFALGNFERAKEQLAQVRATGPLIARKLRAQIGVDIGVALGDVASIAAFLNVDLIDECARQDDVYGVVHLCCSFGAALVTLDKRNEADAYFERAAALIASAYEFVPTILRLAQHRPDLARALRPRIADAARESDDSFLTAALVLIDLETADRDRTRSRATTTQALRTFDELGWSLMAARTAEFLSASDALDRYRRIGHLTAVRRVAAANERGGSGEAHVLTVRERDVAALVATGATNRDVALELNVSQKTVEKHLSSIYAKLAFRSRSELTAMFARSPG